MFVKELRSGLLLIIMMIIPATLWAELPAETRWADPSSVQLNVEFPGDGYHATWDLFRCDCGDLLVHAELNLPGEVETGDLLLVQGKAVLTPGVWQIQGRSGWLAGCRCIDDATRVAPAGTLGTRRSFENNQSGRGGPAGRNQPYQPGYRVCRRWFPGSLVHRGFYFSGE